MTVTTDGHFKQPFVFERLFHPSGETDSRFHLPCDALMRRERQAPPTWQHFVYHVGRRFRSANQSDAA
jgi:hypothetical protein